MKNLSADIRYANARRLVAQCGSLVAFADRIGRSPAQVSHIAGESPTKAIGEKLARDIEVAFGMQPGDMDRSQEALDQPAIHGAPASHGVGDMIRFYQYDTLIQDNSERPIFSPVPHSSSAFATYVRGISMKPALNAGDVIIVDPAVRPVSGEYVMVKCPASGHIIRKYIDEDRQYLIAEHQDWPDRIQVLSGHIIVGTVLARISCFRAR